MMLDPAVSRSPRTLVTILLLTVSLSPHPVAATEIVGAIGAANVSPTGRAPDAPQRVLKPGDDVFFKDRIATKAGGSAQVTFLDRSTLNIGENSEVTIDEFVYRPGQAGSMRAKLKKGFLRYVGGDISHGGGATVATPTVTIGIRGGIGLIATVADGARLAGVPGVPRDFTGGTIVVNGFGTLTVHNSVSETVISRPGFAAFVSSSGAPISAPVRFDMAAAQALTKALGSHKGQTGGASAKAHSAAAQAVAARLPSMDLPVAHPVAVPLNGLDYTAVFSAANSLARVRSQAGQLQQQSAAISAAHETTSPVATASPGSTPGTMPVSAGPATASAATTPVGSTPATAPVTTMPSTMPVATAPETTPPATASATTPVVSMPTTTPVATTPATTPVATAPAAPATTMPETTTKPVAATPSPAPESTPVAKAPAATPVVSTPVPTPMPTPVTTPSAGLPAKTPVATTPTTRPSPTPVATAPATGAAQPGGLSISVPGGTITIGNQGVAFTPSPGKAPTTYPTPIPVVTSPAPATMPIATAGSGHDNGAGNGFANNGHGNGR